MAIVDCKCYILLYLILILKNLSISAKKVDQEGLTSPELHDEESNNAYHLSNMFREQPDGSQVHDPFDMISAPKRKSKRQFSSQKAVNPALNEEMHINEGDEVQEDEVDCSLAVQRWQTLLDNEKQLSYDLQQQLIDKNKFDKNSLNQDAFYERIIKRFYNLLGMEKMLEESDEANSRELLIRITSKDALNFRGFLKNKGNMQEIDHFFYSNIDSKKHEEEIVPFFQVFLSYSTIMDYLDIESSIYVLGLLLAFLCMWAFILFIIDIQRNLRWKNIIMMMFFLVFLMSCLWHWKYMIKLRQSRQHSRLMKQGIEVPKECQEGESLLNRVKLWFLGGTSTCDKYYEDLMVDPSDEISPLMVVSETLSLFLFQPLESFGKHVGKFFTVFFETVPLFYQIPAMLTFMFLIIMFTFAFFNYGVELPLLMGCIKPFHQERRSLGKADVDKMIEESFQQQKEERDLFLRQAKDMLMTISEVAIGFSEHHNVDRILHDSAHIIKKQLEEVVSEKFNGTFNNVQAQIQAGSSSRSEQKVATSSDVATVTSTPLRSQFYNKIPDNVDGINVADALHPRLRRRSSLGPPTSHSTSKESSDNSHAKNTLSRKASLKEREKNGSISHNLEDSNFMLKVKSILEKSVSDNESFQQGNEEEEDSFEDEGFLQKVRKVMTP